MGTFTVLLQVGDLAGRQFADVEALDTGSSDTAIPGVRWRPWGLSL